MRSSKIARPYSLPFRFDRRKDFSLRISSYDLGLGKLKGESERSVVGYHYNFRSAYWCDLLLGNQQSLPCHLHAGLHGRTLGTRHHRKGKANHSRQNAWSKAITLAHGCTDPLSYSTSNVQGRGVHFGRNNYRNSTCIRSSRPPCRGNTSCSSPAC